VFDNIECTEVSEQMVKSIRDKGFVAHYVDNLDNMNKKDRYDVICLFNLIDRCDEPLTLMYQLHQRLKPQLKEHRDRLILGGSVNGGNNDGKNINFNQNINFIDKNDNNTIPATYSNTTVDSLPLRDDIKNHSTMSASNIDNSPITEPYVNLNGRVVIAVPLPLRPSVEMTLDNSTTSWRKPKQNIGMDKCWCCTSYEESLQHLVMNIIEPCGYDVLTVSRLPYLSEGNLHHSHFVLEDVVMVCAPKPEWTP